MAILWISSKCFFLYTTFWNILSILNTAWSPKHCMVPLNLWKFKVLPWQRMKCSAPYTITHLLKSDATKSKISLSPLAIEFNNFKSVKHFKTLETIPAHITQDLPSILLPITANDWYKPLATDICGKCTLVTANVKKLRAEVKTLELRSSYRNLNHACLIFPALYRAALNAPINSYMCVQM